jgi:hypothetical protein
MPLIENSTYMMYIIFLCHIFMNLLIKLYSLAVTVRLSLSICEKIWKLEKEFVLFWPICTPWAADTEKVKYAWLN